MEKKAECKIVQDLLFGYVDNVLNKESQKLVENHLLECSECQKKLEELKKDSIQTSQKNEIDYLKKVRKNSKIKSLLFVLAIILTICFIIYLKNFIVLNSILNKAQKNLKCSNFYKQTMSDYDTGKVSVIRTYYKDGKYKKVEQLYSDSGVELVSTSYSEVGSDEIITIKGNEKIAQKIKLSNPNTNSEENIKFVPFIDNRIIFRLLAPIAITSYTDNFGIGSFSNMYKKCYVINHRFDKQKLYEVWIDKETGLPLKEINKNSLLSYFQEDFEDNLDTSTYTDEEIMDLVNKSHDILKESKDDSVEYKYEFNIVTDEDVAIPDLTEYEIKNSTF